MNPYILWVSGWWAYILYPSWWVQKKRLCSLSAKRAQLLVGGVAFCEKRSTKTTEVCARAMKSSSCANCLVQAQI